MKSFAVATALLGVALTTIPFSSVAGSEKPRPVLQNGYTGPIPAAGYFSNRWRHPNGCEYSRAGRAGERVWYVVLSSMNGRDCVRYFIEKSAVEKQAVTKTFQRYQ